MKNLAHANATKIIDNSALVKNGPITASAQTSHLNTRELWNCALAPTTPTMKGSALAKTIPAIMIGVAASTFSMKAMKSGLWNGASVKTSHSIQITVAAKTTAAQSGKKTGAPAKTTKEMPSMDNATAPMV